MQNSWQCTPLHGSWERGAGSQGRGGGGGREEESREGGRGGEGRTGGGVGSRAGRGWEGCGPESEGSELLATGMVSR